MSRIILEGDLTNISKINQVKVEAELLHDNVEYNGYALLKFQGHSSLKYDKKNFTIKFFEDEDCSVKKKFTFYDWNSENKFIILRDDDVEYSITENSITLKPDDAAVDVWYQFNSGSFTQLGETITGNIAYGSSTLQISKDGSSIAYSIEVVLPQPKT